MGGAERIVNDVANYRYTKNSFFPDDETKRMYMLIGISAAAVLLALVLCLAVQRCGGEPEIPVVEQGNGDEGGFYPQYPDYQGPVVSGDLIIDDGGKPVTDFDVTVAGADGIYERADESLAPAQVTISGQTAESFSFRLEVGDSAVDGTAYFSAPRSAVCEKAEGMVSFEFDAGAVYINVDGTVSELQGVDARGLYALVQAAPAPSGSDAPPTETTTAATTQAAPSKTYDLDLIRSEKVRNAMQGMMDMGDYNLTLDLMDAQGGYGIIYGTGDSALEKEGRSFNLDIEMDAVMYYSFEPGTGREAVVLCTGDGRVYAGVCDGADYHYYTNDSSRASVASAPATITQYAAIKGLSLS